MIEINAPHFTFLHYNTPFEDPHLLIKDKRSGENILLDCGDLSKIPKQELMSVRRLFISHFHMDHFIGFTQLLRCFLCSPPSCVLHIYGPQGLAEYISHAIAAFSWNLLDNQSFSIALTEVREKELLVFPPRIFHMIPRESISPKVVPKTSDTLFMSKDFNIDHIILNHKIPVLGFRLFQKPQPRFLKELCSHTPGPWINTVKQHYFEREPMPVVLSPTLSLPLEELKKYFSIIPSAHFVYLTDFLYNPSDIKLLDFVVGATILFIESHFLERDEALAKKNHHLSTKDVGDLCSRTNPENLHLFHFSRRYLSQATYKDFLSEIQHWKNANL